MAIILITSTVVIFALILGITFFSRYYKFLFLTISHFSSHTLLNDKELIMQKKYILISYSVNGSILKFFSSIYFDDEARSLFKFKLNEILFSEIKTSKKSFFSCFLSVNTLFLSAVYLFSFSLISLYWSISTIIKQLFFGGLIAFLWYFSGLLTWRFLCLFLLSILLFCCKELHILSKSALKHFELECNQKMPLGK